MVKVEYKRDMPNYFKYLLGLLVGLALLVAFALFSVRLLPKIKAVLPVINSKGQEYVQTIMGNQDSPSAKALEPVRFTVGTGPLRVSPKNPRYFTDDSSRAIYLTGSHTWLNLQDGVLTDPPPAFDYTTWLDFLVTQNHNFFRLWVWEQAKWSVEEPDPYYHSPHPWQRTGPGTALDDKPKFDLYSFNQAYFDRLRQRVIEAGDKGFYVSIMLFNGWSPYSPKGFFADQNPWTGHPFNKDNNINGIDGDPNGDNSGDETHELTVAEITAIQEAYAKKVIDTVNDLDNVLYEISNESNGGVSNTAWQYHFIDFIHDYEVGKSKQHPVGMTVQWPNGDNAVLFDSDADWISMNGGLDNPPESDGSKVIIADTDHLCGICGDRVWVWKSFTRGENPLFMDQYDDSYKLDGGGYDMNNPNDVSLRHNLGYTLTYANRMNLVDMIPRSDLCSTGYCLANPIAKGAEYLVYLPNGGSTTVDLSAGSETLKVEWFNPDHGTATSGGNVTGGSVRNFTAPFGGDAILYIYSTSKPAPNPTPSPSPVPPPGEMRQYYLPWICH